MPKSTSSSNATNNANVHNISPPPTLSRPFRSRKNRPCDACRRAKTRCAIPEIGPPCVECQQTRKQCTFDELPPERKKPAKPQQPQQPQPQQPTTGNAISPIEYNELPAFGAISSPSSSKRSPQPPKNYRSAEESQVPSGGGRLDALVVAASEERQLRMRGEPASIDLNADEHLEPHVITSLVTDDLLPIGSKRTGPESVQPSSSTPYIRQVSYDSSKPQYVVFNRRPDKKPPSGAEAQLKFVQTCLKLLHPQPDSSHLASLFFEKFNTAFPIALPGHYESQPQEPAIRARIYLLGLNHNRHYRASSRTLLQLFSSRPQLELAHGRLCSITISLLELSARPMLDVESNYMTLAKTIAQAQLLGLHIDPTHWAIPTWEKDYRRTLWWALRTFDSWMSFLNSRPSHIQAANHNVPVPTLNSVCTISGESMNGPPSPSSESFVFLCRLSMLVAHLQSQVFTLSASIEITREDRLGRVVALETETASLLTEVKAFARDAKSSTGVPSLMMCLLGFRCMLRRIQIELYIGLGSPFTPDSETLDMYAEAVEYFCSLEAQDFDGFWLPFVGHILSSMTSSLIRLSLATTASMQNQNRSNPQAIQMHIQIQANSPTNPMLLLSRLRGALDRAKRDYNWDLSDAALSRADKVVTYLIDGVQTPPSAGGQGSPNGTNNAEYMESVIAALEGRYYVGGAGRSPAPIDPQQRRPSLPGTSPGGPSGMHAPNGHPHPSQLPPLTVPTQPQPPLSVELSSPVPSHAPHPHHYMHHDAAMNIDFNAFGMGWQGHGINLSPGEWDFRSPGQPPSAHPNGTLYSPH